MELKFIWIKKYRQLVNLGVNFNHSGSDSFTYNGVNLKISNRPKQPSLNFGEKITGITALAGQNGSGKSNLCEEILNSTATYTEGVFGFNFTFDGIACYDKHIFYQEDLQLGNISDLNAAGYTVVKYSQSPFEGLEFEWRRQFAEGAFIYYSNLFDFSTAFEGVNLKNISSTNLLYDETRLTTAYYRGSIPESIIEYWPKDTRTELRIYQIGQEFKMVKYYLEYFDTIPFSGPELIVLQSSYSSNNRWLNIKDDNRIFFELEKEIFHSVFNQRYIPPESRDQDFQLTGDQRIESIGRLYRLNILRGYCFFTQNSFTMEIIKRFVYYMSIPEIDPVNAEKIQRLVQIHTQICQLSIFQNIEFNPNHVQSRYEHKFYDWRFAILEDLSIPNNNISRQLLLQLINAEHEFMNQGIEGGIRRISNYSFPTYFSSGELAYLCLFSRLDDAIKLYVGNHYHKNSLIIFLDEGDVGFHPKWNKMYLYWILNFLNSRTEPVKFQLILSTHSPYLLSDLMSENVVLLRRGKNGETEIVPTENFETFGANIHELLANNFFLEDGTIGEFAKTEINKVIDKLLSWREIRKDMVHNNPEFVPTDEKQQVYNVITNIADNIVRGKIFELYQEVFEDQNAAQIEINYLEERLKKLKGNDRN